MGSTASQGSLPTSRSSGESGSEGRALWPLRPGSQRGEGNWGEGWQVLSKGGALVSSEKVDTMPHTSHRLDCTDACVSTRTCTHIHTPPLPHVPTQL